MTVQNHLKKFLLDIGWGLLRQEDNSILLGMCYNLWTLQENMLQVDHLYRQMHPHRAHIDLFGKEGI